MFGLGIHHWAHNLPGNLYGLESFYHYVQWKPLASSDIRAQNPLQHVKAKVKNAVKNACSMSEYNQWRSRVVSLRPWTLKRCTSRGKTTCMTCNVEFSCFSLNARIDTLVIKASLKRWLKRKNAVCELSRQARKILQNVINNCPKMLESYQLCYSSKVLIAYFQRKVRDVYWSSRYGIPTVPTNLATTNLRKEGTFFRTFCSLSKPTLVRGTQRNFLSISVLFLFSPGCHIERNTKKYLFFFFNLGWLATFEKYIFSISRLHII